MLTIVQSKAFVPPIQYLRWNIVIWPALAQKCGSARALALAVTGQREP